MYLHRAVLGTPSIFLEVTTTSSYPAIHYCSHSKRTRDIRKLAKCPEIESTLSLYNERLFLPLPRFHTFHYTTTFAMVIPASGLETGSAEASRMSWDFVDFHFHFLPYIMRSTSFFSQLSFTLQNIMPLLKCNVLHIASTRVLSHVHRIAAWFIASSDCPLRHTYICKKRRLPMYSTLR